MSAARVSREECVRHLEPQSSFKLGADRIAQAYIALSDSHEQTIQKYKGFLERERGISEEVGEELIDTRKALEQTIQAAEKLNDALEEFMNDQPWVYLSCHKGDPVKDCKHCGRYYNARAALSKYAALEGSGK